MAKRFALLVALVGVLAACGPRNLEVFQLQVEPIENTTVTRTLQFIENNRDPGPAYSFSVEVPSDWVGQVETSRLENRITFEYLSEDGVRADLFFIDALSRPQYWQQVGSYPGDFNNVKNTYDTYFIYHLPLDAYYSGLDQAVFEEFAAQVPDIIASFNLVQ